MPDRLLTVRDVARYSVALWDDESQQWSDVLARNIIGGPPDNLTARDVVRLRRVALSNWWPHSVYVCRTVATLNAVEAQP